MNYLSWAGGCTPNCQEDDFNQLLTLEIPEHSKVFGALLVVNFESNQENYISSLDILEYVNSPRLDYKTTAIGLNCMTKKDYSCAIRAFRLLMQHGEASDQVVRQLSWAYGAIRDLNNEEEFLSILIKKPGALSEDYSRLASIYEKQNNFVEAEKWLLEGQKKFALSQDLAINLMWNAFKTNKIDLALERSSSYLLSFSYSSKVVSEFAVLHFMVGNYEKSKDLAVRAITLDEKNGQAHDILGQTLEKLDETSNYLNSLREFQIAVSLDPESYSYLTHLADLISKRDPRSSIGLFEQSLELAKTDDQVEYARKRIELLMQQRYP